MRPLLFAAIVFVLVNSCTNQTAIVTNDLLLSIDFDKNRESAFSEEIVNELRYSEGIKGRGLYLKDCNKIPTLKNTDTTWFSNSNDFSVSIWVNSSKAVPDTSIILSNSDFSKKDAGIYGKRRTNKGITLYCYDGAWGWNIGNGKLHYLYEPIAKHQPIADYKWHQLAFTHNANLKEIRLFYDGINKAVLHIGDLDDRNFMSGTPLRIGGDINGSSSCKSFNGTVDELHVWGETLSPQNIKDEFRKYRKVADEPELENDVLTIVNWNIWHGGTHYSKEKDGFDGIERTTELIKNAGADIVLMQETYGAGSLISSSLGFYYYEGGSTIGAVWGANLSVMSRFPLEDAYMVEERSNYGKNYAFNNCGVKIRLSKKRRVIAFSNWYNRGKPEDLDGALNAWSKLIDNSDNEPIIFGGDFNSVSHLDDGLGKSGHSLLMENAGFTDSYRNLYPDVAKYPGNSFDTSKARIDYIYFKGKDLKLVEVRPIVSNFKGKGIKTPGYPSDHLGIVAKFKIN
ncbi:endonuclease/exonuclease/phosphatase family protein [Bacteroidota bacterium]